MFAQNRPPVVDPGRHLERDTGREVGLDRAGDDVDRGALRCRDDMDAGGAGHLRKALYRTLDLLAGDHHQVRHLVDDDDDERQGLEVEFLALKDRLAGFAVKTGLHGAGDRFALLGGLADALIKAVDVADADLRHLAVAVFHLADGPFERDDGLGWVGDDGRQQMRDAIIDRQFSISSGRS